MNLMRALALAVCMMFSGGAFAATGSLTTWFTEMFSAKKADPASVQPVQPQQVKTAANTPAKAVSKAAAKAEKKKQRKVKRRVAKQGGDQQFKQAQGNRTQKMTQARAPASRYLSRQYVEKCRAQNPQSTKCVRDVLEYDAQVRVGAARYERIMLQAHQKLSVIPSRSQPRTMVAHAVDPTIIKAWTIAETQFGTARSGDKTSNAMEAVYYSLGASDGLKRHNLTSEKGAKGFLQMMPDTHTDLAKLYRGNMPNYQQVSQDYVSSVVAAYLYADHLQQEFRRKHPALREEAKSQMLKQAVGISYLTGERHIHTAVSRALSRGGELTFGGFKDPVVKIYAATVARTLHDSASPRDSGRLVAYLP